jgi:hypothetical protein
MREIRMSGSMRGGRKRAFTRRACLLLYRVPRESLLSIAASNRLRRQPVAYAECSVHRKDT